MSTACLDILLSTLTGLHKPGLAVSTIPRNMLGRLSQQCHHRLRMPHCWSVGVSFLEPYPSLFGISTCVEWLLSPVNWLVWADFPQQNLKKPLLKRVLIMIPPAVKHYPTARKNTCGFYKFSWEKQMYVILNLFYLDETSIGMKLTRNAVSDVTSAKG